MKYKISIILLFLSQIAFAQSQDYIRDINTLVSLSKNYYHYHTEAPDSIEIMIDSIVSEEIQDISGYICALRNPDIDVLFSDYIIKPDTNKLKTIYIVNKIKYNSYAKYPEDSCFLIDSLYNMDVYYYEMVSHYYRMLFDGLTYEKYLKNYEDLDFKLDEYNLNDDTEKAIFFLQAMAKFKVYIWGYMNISYQINYKEALKYLNNYPTVNGKPYYLYTNLEFEDFDMHIYTSNDVESYKDEYIDDYLYLLFYHYACLRQKTKTHDEAHDIYTQSIINNDIYWKHTENPEVFKQLSY